MSISEAQAKTLLGRFYTPPAAKKTKKPTEPKQPSVGEAAMMLHFRAHKIPYKYEFKFCPHRRWKSDFRILGTNILVEVEGGTWSGGRHTRGKGYANDCEKYSWAAANGWTVLRYTTQQVTSGTAAIGVLEAIKNR